MSRYAAIFKKEEGESNDSIGIFMRYGGAPQWVYSILLYLRMLGYDSPAVNGVGMARLIQVISNFEGTDPYGVLIGRFRELPEYDYAYEIDGWELTEVCRNKYDAILKRYDLERFIVRVDLCQPYSPRLGDGLIHMFYTRNESLKDLHLDYYEILYEREGDGEIKQFQESEP